MPHPALRSKKSPIMALFFAMALMQVLIAAAIFYMSHRAVVLQTQVAAKKTAIFALEQALSTLRDAETGQRGFLLTGREEYLAPYESALQRLDATHQSLNQYAGENPEDQPTVTEIWKLVQAKLDELKNTIRIRRDAGMEAAVGRVMDNVGRNMMDQIRLRIGDLERDEQQEIDQAESGAHRAITSRNIALFATLAVNLVFILWAGTRIRRGQRALEVANAVTAEQKQLLGVTLESIGDAVITTDDKGAVTFINKVAQQLTGWTTAQAAGIPLDRVFHIINETSRKPVENPVVKVLREGTIVGLANHTLLVRRDGAEIAIDDSGAPIRGEDGAIQGVVLVFRDISTQRRNEAVLSLSEERLRFAVDAAELGTFFCAVPLDKIVWNAKCKEHFFLSPDAEIDFDIFYARLHPDDHEKTRAAVDRAMKDRQPYDIEYRTVSNEGTMRWVRALGRFYYDAKGTPTRFDGVTIDITAAKEFQEQLQRAKTEAEQANQAKDHFMAALSHELRTPLSPVLATLSSWEDAGVPGDAQPDVQMMRRNVELEARLIDDLLDITRVSKGKLLLNLEEVDMHQVLTQVLRICQSELNARQIQLEVKADAGRHWVRGDSARLQQVLWNVLRNAAKFSEHGARVTILSSNPTDADLHLEIRDFGIGMDPDTLQRVFSPFVQGGDTITRRLGGLGMGLAISRALIDLQGGSLTATSDGPGKGSTFLVKLPTAAAQSGAAVKESHKRAVPIRKGLRILLVEDHEDTARTMALLLKRLEHQVAVAGNVKDALHLARTETFDLIISDVGLPDGTGIEFMQQVREFSTTPAIALTGFGMDEDVARTTAAGFNAHLVKPVNFVRLEALMNQVTGG